MDEFSQRFHEELDRRGIASASEAARQAGVEQQWLSRRLTGATDWKLKELQGICEQLNLCFAYITTGHRGDESLSREEVMEFVTDYLARKRDGHCASPGDVVPDPTQTRSGKAANISERIPRSSDARQGRQD
ncbi:hypothetical protein PP713_13805 [Mycobacterium sp. CSUR Q5927]|nr:hypothetical protein [Mycobacterium sp. CSUR Q5927]